MATKWLLQIEVQIVKVPLPGLEPRPIISRASMLTTTPQRNLMLFLAVRGLDKELVFG